MILPARLSRSEHLPNSREPLNVTTEYTKNEQIPARTGHWPAWVINAILGSVGTAALVFAALVVLWLGQASKSIFTNGADAVTIRAVLRADVENPGAMDLAGRLRERLPDAQIDVITERMGRSLMALQEPWIAQMPDFEVTPLPILIEIQHPELLTNPPAVTDLVEDLKSEPAVDFVAYNETAHNRLVKVAGSALALQQHTMAWLLWALSIGGFIAAVGLLDYSFNRAIPYAFALAALCWGFGWAMAWPVFQTWERTAIQLEGWERLPGSDTSSAIWISALVMLLAAIFTTLSRWLRQ